MRRLPRCALFQCILMLKSLDHRGVLNASESGQINPNIVCPLVKLTTTAFTQSIRVCQGHLMVRAAKIYHVLLTMIDEFHCVLSSKSASLERKLEDNLLDTIMTSILIDCSIRCLYYVNAEKFTLSFLSYASGKNTDICVSQDRVHYSQALHKRQPLADGVQCFELNALPRGAHNLLSADHTLW